MDGYEVCGHLKANPNAEHPRDFSYPRMELPPRAAYLPCFQTVGGSPRLQKL